VFEVIIQPVNQDLHVVEVVVAVDAVLELLRGLGVLLRGLLQALEGAVPGLSVALHHPPHGPSLHEQLRAAMQEEPARGLGRVSKGQARRLLRLLRELEALEASIARHGGTPNPLRPAVALRVRGVD
jgi:hypothetical protein